MLYKKLAMDWFTRYQPSKRKRWPQWDVIWTLSLGCQQEFQVFFFQRVSCFFWTSI